MAGFVLALLAGFYQFLSLALLADFTMCIIADFIHSLYILAEF
jgi:hypothetical protein